MSRPGRWRRSLRARLLFGSTVVLIAAVGTADAAAYLALDDHLSDRTRDSLRTAAHRIGAAPTDRQVALGPNVIQSLVPAGLFVALLDAKGEVLLTSAPAGAGDAPEQLVASGLDDYPVGELVRRETDEGTFQLLRVDVPADAEVTAGRTSSVRVKHVLLGADLGPAEETTRALVRTELLIGLLILVVWAATAWTMIGLGLRPLRAMAAAAHRIAAHEEGRLPDSHPTSETGALATALNEAFDVRARAEANARGFLADASHELRTPLASIRAWTELYRVGGLTQAGAVEDAMASMEADAQRMSRVVEQMLELARLEGAETRRQESVDLGRLVGGVVESLHPLAADRLHFAPPARQVWVTGDHEELRSLTQNLVRNALIHSGESSRVEVTVTATEQHATLTVADDGPGMTETEIARAFDRFWRADDARSRPGGSGLGLAIAHEIARRHEGRVALHKRTSSGLEAVVELPLRAPTTGSADLQGDVSTTEA
ncbi:sensor histidine kinase [Nocardioides pelophilus]|uniref:sensor histidine kinase n=1 Tax=Nocardioides pelophilus TaxID=2172019 RepID=UPI001601A538|nr:HAMP domain-containing sensor histidine kinase [Nocardioides pelophilus]